MKKVTEETSKEEIKDPIVSEETKESTEEKEKILEEKEEEPIIETPVIDNSVKTKFYDDLNREVSEDIYPLSKLMVDSIKGSYVINEILSYGKQLVIVFEDGSEKVISNEDAKELLK